MEGKKYDKIGKVLREEKAYREEQSVLHKKHQGIREEVKIVEKSGVPKATVSLMKSLGRVITGGLLIILATIGLLTLIYPEIREVFLGVLRQIVEETIHMNV